jgi:hypothetical protein
MSDAGVLELFEILQDSLAEGSFVGALGIFIFQIDSLRPIELELKSFVFLLHDDCG